MTPPDATKLQALLDGEHVRIRDRVRTWLSTPGNVAAADLPMEEHREQVLAWARELASEGDPAMGFPVEYGGEDAVARSIASFETLAYGDLSLLVKCGVQFGLFGGAILHLGTERHHERYLRDAGTLALPGCFAMTETGHAAHDGRLAVVFAQLIAGGQERGVHALLVPIRDEHGDPLPGVRLEDCGAK